MRCPGEQMVGTWREPWVSRILMIMVGCTHSGGYGIIKIW